MMLNKTFYLLLLSLIPIFGFSQANSQYPDSGNKIRLGFQTTGDGLIWRDTQPKAGGYQPINNKAAWIILDTMNNKFYHYKNSTWTLAGGQDIDTANLIATKYNLGFKLSLADTQNMLTPYWRSGRFSGVLPLGNGGTGSATQNFVDLTTMQSIGGAKTFTSNISINTSGQSRTISTFYLSGSDGNNIFIGGGGNSSTTGGGASYLGSYNSAIGVNALYSNTTGYNNSAIGPNALYSNTTGYNNSAIGVAALYSNTTGNSNSAIGVSALYANTTGLRNFAIGGDALYANTTGNSNSAIGVEALRLNTTGSSNSAIGSNAGYGTGTNANTTGSNNTFIGYQSVGESSTESNRTWIGNTSTTSTWVGGNLLVGTRTNGTARLQVKGSANTAEFALRVEDSGSNNLLSVQNNGNVGIGTTSPAANLQVSAASSPTIALNVTGSITSGVRGDIAWYNSAISTVASIRATAITDNVGTQLEFYTRPAAGSLTQRMTLDASGNLGLGVTPSAWSANWRAIQLSGGSIFNYLTSEIHLGQNFYYSTSAIANYQNNGFASDYWQYNGQHIWMTAPSGTAGAAISFTQAMTLDASGRLGIGTTSPTSKLELSNSSGDTRLTVTSSGSTGSSDMLLKNASGTVPYNWYIQGLGSNGRFRIYDDAGGTTGEYLTILQNGDIGIGTTSPNYKLDVSGTGYFSSTVTLGGGSRIAAVTGNGLNFYTGGADRLTIASTGAATFSSSVTATSGIFSQSAGNSLQVYQTVATNATTAIIRQTGAGGNGNGDIGLVVDIQGANDADRIANFRYYDGTNYNSRMVVTRGGNVGIGTTSPASSLDVNGNATLTANFNYSSSGTYVRWQNNGTSFGDVGSAGQLVSGGSINDFAIHARSTYNMVFSTNFTERMRITSGGNVIINSLTTNGIVYSNAGTLTNTNPSDSTLKNSINPYTYGLSEILQLKPKTFYYNLDVTRSHLKYGFIAQEVQSIMPNLVRIIGNGSDKLGLESEGIYVAMVNAIKELSAEIDILKQEIINLKNK